MQALVYVFIAIAAASLGAAAYFALSFTPANAILVALVVACVCVMVVERQLRLRAERRLERGIEDLSRLLATDAQAGAVLGRRINALSEMNPGQRLDTIEADISVLGTVIRQVAEAVADLEEKQTKSASALASPAGLFDTARASAPVVPDLDTEPIIPPEMVREALDDNRLVFHIQPIARLPQRRPAGYDLLPRLVMEDDDFADMADFMPRRGSDDLCERIEGMALNEAVAIARKARSGGQSVSIHVPLSRATLSDETAVEQLMATLDANKAIATGLVFVISEAEFQTLAQTMRPLIEAILRKGAGFSLSAVRSLRLDFTDLSSLGVRTLRVDATRLVDMTEAYTDFHLSDIAAYVGRYDLSLLAMNVEGERQIVELLDNDILLVQGEYIAPPSAVRPDLLLEPMRTVTAQPIRRQAEV
jgi:cyclic-di-GMP phosphodiesterase TipF (flagellum assembly factor)